MRGVLMAHLLGASVSAFASNYTWKSGSTDWDSPDSYEEGGKPTDGDIVKIPKNVTVTVDDDSVGFINKLLRIKLDDSTSTVIFNLTTNAVVTCEILYTTTAYNLPYGTIRQNGDGIVTLSAEGDTAYYANIIIAEGKTLKFKQDGASSGTQTYYGDVTVPSNATLFTKFHGRTRVRGLFGYGMVTNVATSGTEYLDIYGRESATPTRFYGTIGGGIRVYSRGNHYLMGTNNTFLGECSAYNYNGGRTLGITGLVKIGKVGDPSSAGRYGTLFTREYAGCFVYLGEGETTDKEFQFGVSTYRPNEFDAGAVGGITFTGKWKEWQAADTRMSRLVLTGSNTVECVLTNAFDTYNGYTRHITKKGTGTWRLAHHPDRKCAGAFTVQNGTLKFDSIAEKGTACSLGLSSVLYDDYTGVKTNTKAVAYALRIGGDTSVTGTLEYAGADAAACTTRPLALKGAGRFRVSGGSLYLGEVFADNGGGTLIYDSANGADVTNTLANVKDGTTNGVLSIVKEGAGTLALSGEQSWSGDLDVREGTVLVDSHYQYWRLTMKENAYACSRYDTSACTDDGSAKKSFQVCEFSLFDAGGLRQNQGLATVNEQSGSQQANTSALMLEPGQAAVENGGSFKYYIGGTSYRVNQLFDNVLGKGYNNGIIIYYASSGLPYITTPERHCKVVMRLTNQNEIAYYDICSSRGTNDTKAFGRCLTAYSIEGSADGRVWEEVAKDDAVELKTGSPHWYGATRTTFTINRQMLALTNVASVAVAPGAKLVANGPVAPIKKLVVDADGGMGTIEGFDFAEEGTIEVGSMTGKSVAAIPAVLLGTDTLANISGWTVVSGGKARNWSVSADADKITVVKGGSVILVQ